MKLYSEIHTFILFNSRNLLIVKAARIGPIISQLIITILGEGADIDDIRT